jgi:murein DD-endopeptidase MepM/ murein hydrolase activator NlpD
MKCFVFALLVCLPLKQLKVNSSYGSRYHPIKGVWQLHEGVDLHARKDTVFAVLNGTVARILMDAALGLNVRLEHSAVETIYGHLSQVFVNDNEPVKVGEPIGVTGSSGRVTGEHLHFAVLYHHRYIDPILFLKMLLRQKECSLIKL